MKTLTVRLPERLVAEIESASRERGVSRSDIVRERLQPTPTGARASSLDDIADLVGSVDGLRPDLSSRKKRHLATTGYGRPRRR